MDGKANGNTIQADTRAKITALNQAINDYMLKKLPARVTIKDFTAHKYAGKSYELKSDALVIDKSNIASIQFDSVQRSQGFLITFKAPVSIIYSADGEPSHIVQAITASVQLGDITDGVNVVVPVNDKLVQAGYNYFTIINDGSFGIHNPVFVNDVLNTSLQALK